jgi:hypothetical protein
LTKIGLFPCESALIFLSCFCSIYNIHSCVHFILQPTIKWGDPGALEDYKGGRDYDSLNKFAAESLKPVCSPSNVDLCDADKKAEIEKFLGMAGDELNKMIAESEEKMEKSEADFKASVELLQASYQDLMKKKDETQEEIKNSGLGLMKACKSHAAKATGSDEL